MRCFVAISIPDNVKSQLRDCQRQLEAIPSGVRWVAIASQHLTLKFLGEVDPARLASINAVLQATASETFSISIQLQDIGAFPSLKKPRVFWVGVQEAGNQLARLAARLETELVACGFPAEERRWNPHVTLGRVKDTFGLSQIADYITMRLRNYKVGSFVAGELVLYRSILKPSGAVYEPLVRHRFKPSGTNGTV
jgi:2'-5' RNA ligase